MNPIQNPEGLIRAQNRVADYIGSVIPAAGGFDAMWGNPDVFQKTHAYADGARPLMLTVEEKPLFGPIGYESTTVYKNQYAPSKAIQTMANNCGFNVIQPCLFTYGMTGPIIDFDVFESEILSKNN